MVSTRYICTLLEKLGYVKSHKSELKVWWKARLHDIFMFVQTCVICYTASYHLFITLTRATQYRPEFVESIFEDAFFSTGVIVVMYMRWNYDEILELINFMERDFSKADANIIRNNEQRCKVLFISILFLNISGAFLNTLESLLPLSEKEFEIRKMIYGKKNPQWRLPYHLIYLGVDESEPAAFPVCFSISLYVMALFIAILTVISNFKPITLLHLQAQYEILANYVQKIGIKHKDSKDKDIFYINIEIPEICYVDFNDKGWNKRFMRWSEIYEQNYTKQIVCYHQKLVIFQEKVCLFENFYCKK